MLISEIAFDLANILFFIGTALLIKQAIKNRKCLRDFDAVGALLTLSALICTEIAYVNLNYLLSFALGIETVSYWLVVSYYSTKHKLEKMK